MKTMDQKELELRQEIYAFLSRHQVMTLAYHDQQGPGACAVWFAVQEDLTLNFLSALSTRHGAALTSGGQVAITVQKDEQSWRSIQGVQGLGFCQPVASEHRASAWQAYSGRFPFVIQPFGNIVSALATITLWSVAPTWLRLIDNTKGFGHKEELSINSAIA
jgi:uncharacterized protein YhbP (UPF0306 family)